MDLLDTLQRFFIGEQADGGEIISDRSIRKNFVRNASLAATSPRTQAVLQVLRRLPPLGSPESIPASVEKHDMADHMYLENLTGDLEEPDLGTHAALAYVSIHRSG